MHLLPVQDEKRHCISCQQLADAVILAVLCLDCFTPLPSRGMMLHLSLQHAHACMHARQGSAPTETKEGQWERRAVYRAASVGMSRAPVASSRNARRGQCSSRRRNATRCCSPRLSRWLHSASASKLPTRSTRPVPACRFTRTTERHWLIIPCMLLLDKQEGIMHDSKQFLT